MKKLMLVAVLLTQVFHLERSALSCGGPTSYSMTPVFDNLEWMLEDIVAPWADEDRRSLEELRLIYPFRLARGAEIDDLWMLAYSRGASDWGSPDSFDAVEFKNKPDVTAYEEALLRRDWPSARNAAQRVVNQIVDMPLHQAHRHQLLLKRAVEFLELYPFMGKVDPALAQSFFLTWGTRKGGEPTTLSEPFQDAVEVRSMARHQAQDLLQKNPSHPRAGTLAFVALQEEVKNTIPDGWRDYIQKTLPRREWEKLESSVDRWLKSFEGHPLADLVRLLKVRLYYLKGEDAKAFAILVSMYPRHLPRLLWEMRYIIVQNGGVPRDVPLALGRMDPLLATALLSAVGVDRETWAELWRVSESRSKEPWATNLQERLLYVLARDPQRVGPLPENFPETARKAPLLWGKLRTVCLMTAGMWDKALEQMAALPPDSDLVRLKAKVYLLSDRPLLAVQVNGLPPETRSYFTRVLLLDEELERLLESDQKEIRDQARLA